MRFVKYAVFSLLIFSFGCGESEVAESQVKRKPRKKRAPFEIIRNDDCFTCHSLNDKTIGPAYIEVARKYDPDPETIDRLATKIIEGGGGLWGGALMSKHPLLKKHDVKNVVKWILNLESEEANQHISGPGIALDDFIQKPSESGLEVDIYLKSDVNESLRSSFPKIKAEQSPSFSTRIPLVNFKDEDAFSPINERFYLKAKGNLNISRRGIYIFKLDKSGLAELKIDGMTVISTRPDDREINLHLDEGEHEVEIHFLGKGMNDKLAWHWIARDQEYYHVVPPEVLSGPSE